MLLFIQMGNVTAIMARKFQYISCYCLSKPEGLISLTYHNFNTSHVTVYRSTMANAKLNIGFQYISCYCLSKSTMPFHTDSTVFQYISCYCLSYVSERSALILMLFQYISCYCLSFCICDLI